MPESLQRNFRNSLRGNTLRQSSGSGRLPFALASSMQTAFLLRWGYAGGVKPVGPFAYGREPRLEAGSLRVPRCGAAAGGPHEA